MMLYRRYFLHSPNIRGFPFKRNFQLLHLWFVFRYMLHMVLIISQSSHFLNKGIKLFLRLMSLFLVCLFFSTNHLVCLYHRACLSQLYSKLWSQNHTFFILIQLVQFFCISSRDLNIVCQQMPKDQLRLFLLVLFMLLDNLEGITKWTMLAFLIHEHGMCLLDFFLRDAL